MPAAKTASRILLKDIVATAAARATDSQQQYSSHPNVSRDSVLQQSYMKRCLLGRTMSETGAAG